MADNSNSSNFSVCTVYDSYQYVIVAAVSSGSAMVSALCCLFVIGLIFFFKKHVFFIQRLILYHCLAALLRSFSTMLRFYRLALPSESRAANVLCAIAGFTNQVTFWFLLVDYSVITFTLLMTVVFRKNMARLEGLFIVLIFVLPLTFNWIPFINNAYGREGPWCSIRNLNFDDCTDFKFGIILRNILQNVPQYVFLALLSLTLIIIILYLIYQRYCKTGKDVHELKKRLNKEVWPLFFFPFGVVLLNVVPVINRLYISASENGNPSYALWILSAILSPLQGGYIALVYTLDRGTLRRLSYKSLAAMLCGKREDEVVQEYPMESSERSESVLINRDDKADYTRVIDNSCKALI